MNKPLYFSRRVQPFFSVMECFFKSFSISVAYSPIGIIHFASEISRSNDSNTGP